MSVDNKLEGIIGKFDVSGFDNNYLRRRGEIINCLDYILCTFFRMSVDVRG